MRATVAYIRTNDVAAHCATVARRHRDSRARWHGPHKTTSYANWFIRARHSLCVLVVLFSVIHTHARIVHVLVTDRTLFHTTALWQRSHTG